MKLLLDTNVILDIALNREPFVHDAVQLIQVATSKNIAFYVSATTITDLYYIIRRSTGKESALGFIKDLLEYVHIAGVDQHTVMQALEAGMSDFEDAIQVYSAKQIDATAIITRNISDFSNAPVPAFTPSAFLKTGFMDA